MRIGEIAQRASVRPSAIHFYERAGILPPAFRQNSQRSFSADAVLYLGIITVAREAGFSVAEIRTLFRGFDAGASVSKRWKRLARKRLKDLDLLVVKIRHMQSLLRKAMHCQCLDLKDCGRIILRAPRG